MNNSEFEQFVREYGAHILRFCRMTAGEKEAGDELYQDTMLKLTEKVGQLDTDQNTKSYALSVSIFLWKNRRRKNVSRKRLVPTDSLEVLSDEGWEPCDNSISPEERLLSDHETRVVRQVVYHLPEKYRVPIHLFYSAEMQIAQIAQILHIPEGTVKTRMRKAKKMIKDELEALGYDR